MSMLNKLVTSVDELQVVSLRKKIMSQKLHFLVKSTKLKLDLHIISIENMFLK